MRDKLSPACKMNKEEKARLMTGTSAGHKSWIKYHSWCNENVKMHLCGSEMSLNYTSKTKRPAVIYCVTGVQARACASICISCMNAFLMPVKSLSFSWKKLSPCLSDMQRRLNSLMNSQVALWAPDPPPPSSSLSHTYQTHIHLHTH